MFQANDLSYIYFFMIHKNDIIGYKVIEEIYKTLSIQVPKVMLENLTKMFIKCGPSCQKMFLSFFNKNEYELSKVLGTRRIRYPFFLTYDILRLIKEKMQKAAKLNNIIKLKYLREFLINYTLVDKQMSFVWNSRCFSHTYTPLVDVPLYRIGQVDPENSLAMCQEFLALIDWFNNFIQEHKDRTLRWDFFPMWKLLLDDRRSNKKLSAVAVDKEKLFEGNILWLILRHIDEQKVRKTKRIFAMILIFFLGKNYQILSFF